MRAGPMDVRGCGGDFTVQGGGGLAGEVGRYKECGSRHGSAHCGCCHMVDFAQVTLHSLVLL